MASGQVTRCTDDAVAGRPIDGQTRCVHYHGPADIVAIKFPCCGRFYPCIHCHEETAGHPATRWPADALDEPAVLCGVCRAVLTIQQYLDTLAGSCRCPSCGAAFNPGCRHHLDRYFTVAASTGGDA